MGSTLERLVIILAGLAIAGVIIRFFVPKIGVPGPVMEILWIILVAAAIIAVIALAWPLLATGRW